MKNKLTKILLVILSICIVMSFITACESDKEEQTQLRISNVEDRVVGEAPFQLVTVGGDGKGKVTFEKIDGPASVSASGYVEIQGVGDLRVRAIKAGNRQFKKAVSDIVVIRIFEGYRVSFNLNNADNIQDEAFFDQIVLVGGKATAPETVPEKISCEYKGWYFNDRVFDFDTVITRNIIINARFDSYFNHNSTNDITGIKSAYLANEEIFIPDEINGYPIYGINSSAFAYKDFRKVTLPETLKTIKSGAFAYCQNLEEINFPETLEQIGDSAFSNCTKLAIDLVLPEGFHTIGKHAFYNCTALTSITLPGTIRFINEASFASVGTDNAEPISVTVGENYNMVKINEGEPNESEVLEGISFYLQCFYKANIAEIVLPETTVHIGSWAFTGTKISTLTIPSNCTSIFHRAFADMPNLTRINVAWQQGNKPADWDDLWDRKSNEPEVNYRDIGVITYGYLEIAPF